LDGLYYLSRAVSDPVEGSLNGTVDVVNLILGFGIKVLVFGSVVSLLEFVLRAEEQVGILKHVVSLSSVV